ncbi:hypothetical protein RHMOL_Rhmol04G0149700 [Rhododendron molle]|uniref:Uncharacterized protein n=1 Tax=Rhododendron molle TaxID=49168 RepID=A0ACC0P0V9_RHOML|nr:hypothetical protein RHMOL_Rhmol04G0149700 [Rhododendron molle]
MHQETQKTKSVVAAALGVPALLPFLKEACEREDSWHARHTGVKTVQQIAVRLGSDVCPHLESLVGIIGYCLNDENEEVQIITPLCLSALAEASALNGFESFDSVFKTLCNCTSLCRGKVLGDFLVAICSLIPLMDATHAAYYAKEVMDILIRLIKWNDFQTKETVVKVMSQCLSTEGVDADYYRKEILPEFFRNSGGSKPGR